MGATLQLSWTTNHNLWALTLFFKYHAPYFSSTYVLGYIWICMRQISPKKPSKYLLFTKVVRKHGFRCFTEMYHFWMQCFFKNNYSELVKHLNFSKLLLQMYFLLSFPFFWGKHWVLHVLGVLLTKTPQKEGVLD